MGFFVEDLRVDDRLAEEAIPEPGDGQWWVAHTKSRNEKALARDLERMAVGYYLPLRPKTTRSPRTGRTSVSTVPLFTGYVFFLATQLQRYQVLATNRVANALIVPQQQQLVTQLRRIHRVLATETAFEHFAGVQVGQWVKVVGGPLTGLEGQVVKRLGKLRLCLSIDILGQSVLAEVAAHMLEPIDEPSISFSGSSPASA